MILNSSSIFHCEYKYSANFKSDGEITVGAQTRELVEKLSHEDQKKIYDHVKKYFVASCDYIVANFPWDSKLLQNAEVANISKKETASFASVKYFLDKFPCFLFKEDSESTYEAIDKVVAEFLNYQTVTIPNIVISINRPDQQWALLSKEIGLDGKPL